MNNKKQFLTNKRSLSLIVILTIAFAMALPFAVTAQTNDHLNAPGNSTDTTGPGGLPSDTGNSGGLPTQTNQQPQQSSGTYHLDSPIKDKNTTLTSFIGDILDKIVLPIGAVVVVIFIIYSGFLFVVAQGNESKLEKAKTTLLWTIIGAAVLLGSWAIAQVVQSTINELRSSVGMVMYYLG